MKSETKHASVSPQTPFEVFVAAILKVPKDAVKEAEATRSKRVRPRGTPNRKP